MRHKYADLIHAYAEGAEIERKDFSGKWYITACPAWDLDGEYRIKPKEPEWYENIPDHGVLCWVQDARGLEVYIDVVKHYINLTEFPFSGLLETWRCATPLTNDEIKQFLRGDK